MGLFTPSCDHDWKTIKKPGTGPGGWMPQNKTEVKCKKCGKTKR